MPLIASVLVVYGWRWSFVVVGVAAYDPDATDFAKPIRRLVGYELLSGEEKKIIKEREALIRSARRLPTEEAAQVREDARAMLGPNGEPLPHGMPTTAHADPNTVRGVLGHHGNATPGVWAAPGGTPPRVRAELGCGRC